MAGLVRRYMVGPSDNQQSEILRQSSNRWTRYLFQGYRQDEHELLKPERSITYRLNSIVILRVHHYRTGVRIALRHDAVAAVPRTSRTTETGIALTARATFFDAEHYFF